MTDSCGNCAFWHQPPNSGLPDDGGLCRRYPPQLMKVDSGANFYFPSMMRIAWCGEWKSTNPIWASRPVSNVRGN